jgi:hypothetical protein
MPPPGRRVCPAGLLPSSSRCCTCSRTTTREWRGEAAARRLLKQGVGELPEYVEKLARLELAKNCPDKKAVLGSLLRLGDARARAGWERLSSEPKDGLRSAQRAGLPGVSAARSARRRSPLAPRSRRRASLQT